MTELKSCPFCGGKGHIRYKNSILYYINDFCDRKVRMRSYVQCGKCKARGGVFASTIWVNPCGAMKKDDKEYIDEQVSRLWNARAET